MNRKMLVYAVNILQVSRYTSWLSSRACGPHGSMQQNYIYLILISSPSPTPSRRQPKYKQVKCFLCEEKVHFRDTDRLSCYKYEVVELLEHTVSGIVFTEIKKLVIYEYVFNSILSLFFRT